MLPKAKSTETRRVRICRNAPSESHIVPDHATRVIFRTTGVFPKVFEIQNEITGEVIERTAKITKNGGFLIN